MIRRPLLRPLLSVLLLAAWASQAAAQTPTPVSPDDLVGERLRVRIVEGLDPVVGTVVGHETGLLQLQDSDGRTFQVDPGVVASLEQSVGRRSNVGRGFMIGAGVGAAIGVVGGLVVYRLICGDSQCTGGGGTYVLSSGAAVALGGGVVGGLIGSASSRDHWMPIEVGSWSEGMRLHLGAAPDRRFAVSVSLPLGGR